MSPGRPRCVVLVRPRPAARLATPEELAADAAWQPPETTRDRLSRWSMRALRAALLLVGAPALALLVLWGVPTLAAVRSPGYAPARARLERDPSLQAMLGEPLEVERVPLAFRLEGEGARYTFLVRGPFGEAAAEVETHGPAVGAVRRRYETGLPERWARHLQERSQQ